MDGSAFADLADLRTFPGTDGHQLCDGPAELSVSSSEGETNCSQGQMFLITPQGD